MGKSPEAKEGPPMASREHRLRKYLRKKRRATEPKKFDRLARLYWRYHRQVHGNHVNLWSIAT